MTAEEGTIGTSWMSTESRPPESDNRKVRNSREDTNIQQEHQQQQQELTARTFATSTVTIGTSQMSTAEGSPATAGMPEIVKMPQKHKY
jgi:hypothetical protein